MTEAQSQSATVRRARLSVLPFATTVFYFFIVMYGMFYLFIVTSGNMAAVVFGERCVRVGNFVDLLRLSSRLRPTVLPWRHIASQKATQTKRSAKGSLFYVVSRSTSLRDCEDTPT